jgi:hypothetical protein
LPHGLASVGFGRGQITEAKHSDVPKVFLHQLVARAWRLSCAAQLGPLGELVVIVGGQCFQWVRDAI